MWIYENPEWTNFKWDNEVILPKLLSARHEQGRLLGRMEHLGFNLINDATLSTLTQGIVKSAIIENDNLNPAEVRSSIARKLGFDYAGLTPSTRHVDGFVEMMLDATQHPKIPLTQERLWGWHAALFPTGYSGIQKITTGAWRTPESDPMRVISGIFGNGTIHFEAPPSSVLQAEMLNFLAWFNQGDAIDPFLKAGIAHLWFVTLHPFDDGNGRIVRAISELLIAQADNTPHRFYSLSTQISQDRAEYYTRLETQQKSTTHDITPWLSWFLECIERSILNADTLLASTFQQAQHWSHLHQHALSARQHLALSRMLDPSFKGFMQTSKYAKIAKCSTDTALRDIQDLLKKGILLPNPTGGRNTSYRLNIPSH